MRKSSRILWVTGAGFSLLVSAGFSAAQAPSKGHRREGCGLDEGQGAEYLNLAPKLKLIAEKRRSVSNSPPPGLRPLPKGAGGGG